ncbi:hypothetical protein BKA58DRAFT_447083 [Alternaria rosae]|uniref:uncharacterized protein n=1 Tax=Alternaria rosae TaxID=1187941 RepID=UPI001E8CA4C3|nr:uncharacterized protein BKA58DRAFT_447083 [Alternaria rosae]KAH6882458.1 hypothetical protein BKA58DRAFT_447083 [Alternaria rosae]
MQPRSSDRTGTGHPPLEQRNWTISTIRAGDRDVTDHYTSQIQHAGGRGKAVSPGLPDANPIPVDPFTATDVNHAKTTQTMPASTPTPTPTSAPTPTPAAAVPVPVYVSSNLHEFWPRLPWSPVPKPPPFDMQQNRVTHASTNDNSLWHGIKLLGFGSYGAAGLWVEADAANNICDRMVIKEAKASTPGRWREPKNWRDRLLQETRIHQLLEELRAANSAMCRHIIRLRAHRLWMEERRYRLYIDLHSGGDINRAMTFCVRNWEKENPLTRTFFIPEGLVWYTIKALGTACLVLREGTIDDTLVDGWRPITHLDLQLPNVLLDVYTPRIPEVKEKSKAGSSKSARLNRADTDDWRAEMPPVMPILADFGISFFSPNHDDCPITDNPNDYVIHETDTRYPPEMHQQDPPYFLKLNEKTDVWGIDNIAWRLLCNKQAGNGGPVRCDSEPLDSTSPGPKPKIPLALAYEFNFTINDETGVFAAQSSTQYTAEKYRQ